MVVVDSVYSTTGAVCPLQEMVEVVEKHGAMIMVDESHSIGTHGPRGAGLCAELGLTERVHFISGSLAKVAALIAQAGGNIVDVQHERVFGTASVKSTEIEFLIETRDRAHTAALVQLLEKNGVSVSVF